MTPMPHRYVLAIHGGAGTVAPGSAASHEPYHEGLRLALAAGEAVVNSGGAALDAVVAAVVALEEWPLFNAGHGAVFTAEETHELDAGVMDGATLAAGAVAGVRTVRRPVLAALEVLRDGRCVLMGGDAADRFAAARGLEIVEPAHFSTEHRRAQLRAVRARGEADARLDHDAAALAARTGTVGAVALDRHGHLAAATSTGGMTNKLAGRIGDSPIVGAGVYANDASCAVSATGTGEHFVRACIAHDVHARMAYGGLALDSAAREAIGSSLVRVGGRGGIVCVGRDGSLAMPFNTPGMYRGWVREGGPAATAIF
jgi:beta-aspartyl-peptidase (threonine type)